MGVWDCMIAFNSRLHVLAKQVVRVCVGLYCKWRGAIRFWGDKTSLELHGLSMYLNLQNAVWIAANNQQWEIYFHFKSEYSSAKLFLLELLMEKKFIPCTSQLATSKWPELFSVSRIGRHTFWHPLMLVKHQYSNYIVCIRDTTQRFIIRYLYMG